MKDRNTLPVFADQQNPDDTVAYVGRNYVEYRNCHTHKTYVVFARPRIKFKKKVDEDQERYEQLAGRYY